MPITECLRAFLAASPRWYRSALLAQCRGKKLLLELFCGENRSWSKCAEQRGYHCITLDMNPKCGADICVDLLQWRYTRGLAGLRIDAVAASPDCCVWSQMTDFNRTSANSHHAGTTSRSVHERKQVQVAVLQRVCDILDFTQPRLFWIENPRSSRKGIGGGMRTALGEPVATVSYCRYHTVEDPFFYKKDTHIWTNGGFTGRRCNKDALCVHRQTSEGNRHPEILSDSKGARRVSDLAKKHRAPQGLAVELLQMQPAVPVAARVVELRKRLGEWEANAPAWLAAGLQQEEEGKMRAQEGAGGVSHKRQRT